MKISILLTGDVPPRLRKQFGSYVPMFHDMFNRVDAGFSFETIAVCDSAPLPEPSALEGIVITGSAAGVYDQTPWMDPLRAFIRNAYESRTPMAGICFGHQIMADALGGDVRKSEKGWSVGRHIYRVDGAAVPSGVLGRQIAIAASHQDQVIAAPSSATVFMSSAFTPNAGLVYANGAAISMQPHPEFAVPYSSALCDLRLDNPLSAEQVNAAKASLDLPLDNGAAARFLAGFLKGIRQ